VRQDAKALAERLTLAGIEVGAVTLRWPRPSNMLWWAKYYRLPRIRKADRLRICQVNAGQKAPLTIVCGAANAATGLKAPVALEAQCCRTGRKSLGARFVAWNPSGCSVPQPNWA